MPQYYFEDGVNVRTNTVTIVGGNGPTYDAVLSAKVSAESATEPVISSEAKTWCAIDGSDYDTIITLLIKKARKIIEQKHNCSLITRTIEAVLYGGTKLPYTEGNVYTVTSIADEDANVITGPYNDLDGMEKYTVIYNVTNVDAKVAELKIDVLQKIANLYENRGD